MAFSFTAASWIGSRLAVLIIKYCAPSDAGCLCFGLEPGAALVIDSLSGPVTQNGINSFKDFMREKNACGERDYGYNGEQWSFKNTRARSKW